MSNHKIKILAPIDKIDEAMPLIKAGADEFYCGVMINGQRVSCQRGTSAEKCNLPNLEALKKLANLIKRHKKKIFLALNLPFERSGIIDNNLEKIKKINLDGIIIGNINLMDKVKKYNWKIIASSLLETKNEETVRLLNKEFGVKRIIFDRQITLDDLKNIVPKFPKIEFETFILESGCRSLNGACRYFLVTDNDYNHFCKTYYSFLRDSKNKRLPLSLIKRKAIIGRLRMPFKCCGVCALFHFKKYKIASVKVVGRGYSTEAKLINIRFIRDAIDILEKNYSQKEFYRRMEELFENTFHRKCRRQYCYYPHFFNT